MKNLKLFLGSRKSGIKVRKLKNIFAFQLPLKVHLPGLQKRFQPLRVHSSEQRQKMNASFMKRLSRCPIWIMIQITKKLNYLLTINNSRFQGADNRVNRRTVSLLMQFSHCIVKSQVCENSSQNLFFVSRKIEEFSRFAHNFSEEKFFERR